MALKYQNNFDEEWRLTIFSTPLLAETMTIFSKTNAIRRKQSEKLEIFCSYGKKTELMIEVKKHFLKSRNVRQQVIFKLWGGLGIKQRE